VEGLGLLVCNFNDSKVVLKQERLRKI